MNLNKHKKKILGVIILLFIIPVLSMGIWMGVNLWPRKLEPLLWTEADIKISDDKSQNAYYALLVIRENPKFSMEALERPDSLDDLVSKPFPKIKEDKDKFWSQVRQEQISLDSFILHQQTALEEYNKLLTYPQFIDQNELSLLAKKVSWPTFLDLHKIVLLSLYQEILLGHSDLVTQTWLKIFKMDQSSLESARGIMSHAISMANLSDDLTALAYFQDHLSLDNRNQMSEALRLFDIEKISYRRPLIAEYLQNIFAEESIRNEALKENHGLGLLWIKIVMNPALFRQNINRRFRGYEKFLTAPQEITEIQIKQSDQERKSLTHGWFWWFVNPAGKAIESMVSVNLLDMMKEFYEEKVKWIEYKTELLKSLS